MNKANEENRAGSESPGYLDPHCPFGAQNDAVCDSYLLPCFSEEGMRGPRGCAVLLEQKEAVKKGLLKEAGPTRKDTF